MQIFLPGSSLLGHLCGILSGYIILRYQGWLRSRGMGPAGMIGGRYIYGKYQEECVCVCLVKISLTRCVLFCYCDRR